MTDILEHLTAEHREAESLIAKLTESELGTDRDEMVRDLTVALLTHMAVEEQFLYPIVSDVLAEKTRTEAENEHALVRDALENMADILREPGFGAAVAMLDAVIVHHVRDEEHDMFPMLREHAADRVAQLDPDRCQQEVLTMIGRLDEATSNVSTLE